MNLSSRNTDPSHKEVGLIAKKRHVLYPKGASNPALRSEQA